MDYVFLYFALAIIVAVAAKTRGRSGFGWFLLAILISPLIAGLLVLALRRIDREAIAAEKRERLVQEHSTELISVPPASNSVFEPDGVIRGFPYRVGEDGAVEAMMTTGAIRFRTMDQFLAAAEGRDAAQVTSLPSKNVSVPTVKTSILRVFRRSGSSDRMRKYKILVNGTVVGTIARNDVADFQVPDGRLMVAARIDWAGSQPLMIDAAQGKRIEIEVSHTRSAWLVLWSMTFGSGSYLTLKQLR